MKIRNGIFAEYKKLDLKLVETRSDVPISDDKKAFQLWYQNLNDCPYDDFEKDKFGNGFYKNIPISQIEKATLIITFAKYKKLNVEVFEGRENKVQITSRNKMIAEELNMIRVGEEWYKKEVEISDLDLIWEEKIEIKKSKNLYGEILKLNEIWKDKRKK